MSIVLGTLGYSIEWTLAVISHGVAPSHWASIGIGGVTLVKFMNFYEQNLTCRDKVTSIFVLFSTGKYDLTWKLYTGQIVMHSYTVMYHI